MSLRPLKKLLIIFTIGILLYVLYVELLSSIQQIKMEYAGYRQVINQGEATEEFNENSIDVIKKLMRVEERRSFKVFWKGIDRKESYNNELQYYCKANAIINEAAIEITSKKEKKGDKDYTSGLVESVKAYKYGYFEFIIEISEGKGIFPAIWFMPDDGSQLPEIDLFEMIGSEPYDFYGVIHYMNDEVQGSDYFRYKTSKKEQYCVALEWKEEAITWYIDGREIYITKNGVPKDYMYIIINQAIGGDWPGEPDDAALPCKFKIVSSHIEPVYKKGRN